MASTSIALATPRAASLARSRSSASASASTSATSRVARRLTARWGDGDGDGDARGRHQQIAASSTRWAVDAADARSISTAKEELFESMRDANRGLDASDDALAAIEAKIRALEALNPTSNPANSALVDGRWEVVFSTAPPPSNGSLGPFKGTAFQEISLENGSYVNVLSIPPNDWLGARLVATFAPVMNDSRGELWTVTFDAVAVTLFDGAFSPFAKTFKDTTRVWRTTFIDAETRVVRAARTMEALTWEGARGRKAVAGDEDDCVFVMKRAR